MKQKEADGKGARQVAASPAPREASRESGPREALGQPTHDAVARRAYELYLDRGAEGGRELDDWFRAEAELRGDQ